MSSLVQNVPTILFEALLLSLVHHKGGHYDFQKIDGEQTNYLMSSGNWSIICMFLLCVLGHYMLGHPMGLVLRLFTRCNLPKNCNRLWGSVLTIALLIVTVTWLTKPTNLETRTDKGCVTLIRNLIIS